MPVSSPNLQGEGKTITPQLFGGLVTDAGEQPYLQDEKASFIGLIQAVRDLKELIQEVKDVGRDGYADSYVNEFVEKAKGAFAHPVSQGHFSQAYQLGGKSLSAAEYAPKVLKDLLLSESRGGRKFDQRDPLLQLLGDALEVAEQTLQKQQGGFKREVSTKKQVLETKYRLNEKQEEILGLEEAVENPTKRMTPAAIGGQKARLDRLKKELEKATASFEEELENTGAHQLRELIECAYDDNKELPRYVNVRQSDMPLHFYRQQDDAKPQRVEDLSVLEVSKQSFAQQQKPNNKDYAVLYLSENGLREVYQAMNPNRKDVESVIDGLKNSSPQSVHDITKQMQATDKMRA